MTEGDWNPVMARRRAGVLLHPTSLPGAGDNGELGPDAFRFADFLAACGFTVWQTLPLGPVHEDLSPYACKSVHAGNEALISLQRLQEAGWLPAGAPTGGDEARGEGRERLLRQAFDAFTRDAEPGHAAAFGAFKEEHAAWLDDYVLFQTIREAYRHLPWWRWPAELRDRTEAGLGAFVEGHREALEYQRFLQYAFYLQWRELRAYAAERGVLMFGDMPLFVAEDSADVWAHRECFRLDGEGRPEVVAGVPPDYFSDTGQRWGNPHYDWARMERDGFQWWKRRMASQLELFDLVRIDHFRGLESFWEVSADEDTAMNGHWVKAPGAELLQTFQDAFHQLPLVAEDLGIITDEVEALRDRFRLPGMRILHFAFGDGPGNPYLPHNFVENTVAYTGTHDNNTTLGWFRELDEATRHHVRDYLDCAGDELPDALCRAAVASVARLAVLPMQDVLRLDGEHRMNSPGRSHGTNWRWRFGWDQLNDGIVARYRHLLELYGRA